MNRYVENERIEWNERSRRGNLEAQVKLQLIHAELRGRVESRAETLKDVKEWLTQAQDELFLTELVKHFVERFMLTAKPYGHRDVKKEGGNAQ